MIVNVEFLVSEPIENVITSLNFKVDKTIFFGYSEVIEAEKRRTERFLKKYCDVDEVFFYPVSHTDFEAVQKVLRKRIEQEKEDGNQVFFDITGGEPLVLAALWLLSGELGAPMHLFDIERDELIELNTTAAASISKCALRRKVELNLDKYIEMQGGVINYRLNKALNSANNKDFDELMPRLWKVSDGNSGIWNSFSDLLKRYSNTEYGLTVELGGKALEDYFKSNKRLDSARKLKALLDQCAAEGLLEQVSYEGKDLFFRYKNAFVK